MSRDIALNIAINAGQAVSEAERLRTELEATEQAVEGLSATEITARGFSDAATEIEGMRRAAEALGDALGPELSSKVGAGGFAALIADARTAGATFDEIIADADTLAAGVRDLDTAMGNVDTGGLSGIAPAADVAVGGVRRVGDEAGRSRQALGQVGGEAVQQFSSLLGPLQGVSYELGNVASQGLSGTAGLKQLALTAGPMIGLGLAVAGASKLIEGLGAKQRLVAERTEEVSDAFGEQVDRIIESGDAAQSASAGYDALAASMAGTGEDGEKFTETLGALGITIDETGAVLQQMKDDPVAALAAVAEGMGFTAEQAQHLAETVNATDANFMTMQAGAYGLSDAQREAIKTLEAFQDAQENIDLDTFAQSQLNSMVATDALGRAAVESAEKITGIGRAEEGNIETLNTAVRIRGQLTQASEALAAAVAAESGSIDGATGSLEGYAAAEAAVTFAVEAHNNNLTERIGRLTEAAGKAREHAGALLAEADALRGQAGAYGEGRDAVYSARDAQEALRQAIIPSTEAINNAGGDLLVVRGVMDDFARSADAAAQAEVNLARETAEAKGQSLSQIDALQIQNDAFVAQASTVQGPLRTAILEHAAAVNGIPAKKVSEIQALIDQGRIEEAGKLLNDTSKPRAALMKAEAKTDEAEEQLNRAARFERKAKILATAIIDAADEILGRMTDKKRTAKIGSDADVALAEQKLARTERAERTAKIFADADVALAEQKLTRTQRAERKAVIFTDAIVALAEQKLERVRAAPRTAKIGSDADTQLAEQELARTAAATRTAEIVAVPRDNASGALNAIASTVRYARITAIVSNIVERT